MVTTCQFIVSKHTMFYLFILENQQVEVIGEAQCNMNNIKYDLTLKIICHWNYTWKYRNVNDIFSRVLSFF